MALTFGMQFTYPQDEAVPVIGANFSKAWIIETSADADAALFPLNTPVRFSTSDKAFTDNLGTGYLADAVRAINSQLGPINSGADIVVTRVEEDTNPDPEAALAATSANIVAALADASELPSQVNMNRSGFVGDRQLK